MVEEYTVLPQEKVLYGAGSVSELPAEVERLGGRRAFIITGNTLANKTPLGRQLVTLLGPRHAGTFSGVHPHVPQSSVQAAAGQAREKDTDLLISFGGGSPIDTAKAVAWTLANGGTPPPHIAIPTTLSAAEYSHIAGYTDESSNTKDRYADPRLTPRVVILDPQLTLETPLWLWSSSGIRALDHAVETLYAPGEHPVQDVLALRAIEDLFHYLPAAREKPDDVDVRLRCQMAAWMSFFAPATIKYGLSHTLSKSFGTTYGVPHGITSCITLPAVMRYMAEREPASLAPMAHTLSLVDSDAPQQTAALATAEAVEGLILRLELPTRLRDVDVPREAIERIATIAVGDDPRRQDVLHILEAAW